MIRIIGTYVDHICHARIRVRTCGRLHAKLPNERRTSEQHVYYSILKIKTAVFQKCTVLIDILNTKVPLYQLDFEVYRVCAFESAFFCFCQMKTLPQQKRYEISLRNIKEDKQPITQNIVGLYTKLSSDQVRLSYSQIAFVFLPIFTESLTETTKKKIIDTSFQSTFERRGVNLDFYWAFFPNDSVHLLKLSVKKKS